MSFVNLPDLVMSRFAVIGGGITGLSACHFIRRLIPSAQVTLLERGPVYGGWMQTKRIPFSPTNPSQTIPIELGPNSIRGGNDERSQITAELISDLNLSDDVVAPSDLAQKRFIYSENKLHSMERLSTKCLRTAMLWMPWHQLFHYFKGGFPERYCDESIESFFRRNFGAKLTYHLASAFVNGVYGGGIHHLSISACSPFHQIKDIEREYGSYFIGGIRKMLSRRKSAESQNAKESESDSTDSRPSVVDLSKFPSFTFREGLHQIINALVHRLESDDHVRLYRNFEVESIGYSEKSQCMELEGNGSHYEFDYVINAVQPRNSTMFLDSNTDLEAFNLSASMLTVNVVFRDREFVQEIKDKFKGFGVLVPRELGFVGDVTDDDERSLLGVIYYSSVFPPCSFNEKMDCHHDDGDVDDGDVHEEEEEEEEEGVLSLVMMFGGPQFAVHRKSASEIVSLCKSKLKLLYDIDVDDEKRRDIVCDGQDPVEVFSMDNAGCTGSEILYNINRLEHAVDHYLVGHLEKKQNLREHVDTMYNKRVALIGSGYDGVGIPDCILSAYTSIKAIAGQMAEMEQGQTIAK